LNGGEKMQDYEVEIKGMVPLLHNRYPVNAMDITKKTRKGKIRDPKEDAKKCLYINAKGKIYQPADHIEGALIKVGSAITIAGAGKKTYKDLMKTNVMVIPQEIPFTDGDKYEVDTRLCVLNGRVRIPVSRPRWDEWGFTFKLRLIDETLVPEEVLKTLLEIAGREQGIGTYRPKFGRFEVVKFEAVK